MTVTFTVKGKPQGCKTPGKNFHKPQKTRDYEILIGQEYKAQCKVYFANVPLMVNVTAFVPIPKSVSKKTREMMLIGLDFAQIGDILWKIAGVL